MPLLLGVTDIIVAGDSVSQVPDGHAELTVDKTGILCDEAAGGRGCGGGAYEGMGEWPGASWEKQCGLGCGGSP